MESATKAIPDVKSRLLVMSRDRVGKSYRKALGWPFLDVEASQVPVQLCASNCYRPTRRIEAPALAASRTASAASARWHIDVLAVCQVM